MLSTSCSYHCLTPGIFLRLPDPQDSKVSASIYSYTKCLGYILHQLPTFVIGQRHLLFYLILNDLVSTLQFKETKTSRETICHSSTQTDVPDLPDGKFPPNLLLKDASPKLWETCAQKNNKKPPKPKPSNGP